LPLKSLLNSDLKSFQLKSEVVVAEPWIGDQCVSVPKRESLELLTPHDSRLTCIDLQVFYCTSDRVFIGSLSDNKGCWQLGCA